MLKKLFSSILVSLLLLPNISKSLETSWEGINEAKIRIISPFSNTNSSNHFIVGLEYKLEDSWKTYWKSPKYLKNTKISVDPPNWRCSAHAKHLWCQEFAHRVDFKGFVRFLECLLILSNIAG